MDMCFKKTVFPVTIQWKALHIVTIRHDYLDVWKEVLVVVDVVVIVIVSEMHMMVEF